MPRSLQEYHARWQQAMQQLNINEIVEDPELTDESCVIFETAHSTPISEGMAVSPHSLQHCVGNRMLEFVQTNRLAQFTRHVSLNTLKWYIQGMKQGLLQAVETIAWK